MAIRVADDGDFLAALDRAGQCQKPHGAAQWASDDVAGHWRQIAILDHSVTKVSNDAFLLEYCHLTCEDFDMSETAVMTLRLPKGVKRGVERLAARFGHKPAQLGARLIEEGLRRRDFPQIDLRETAAGRVAYITGTRFAVHWIVEMVPKKMRVERFAREYGLSTERIRAALAYANAFPKEIESDKAHAEENRKWIEAADAAARSDTTTDGRRAVKVK